MPKIDAQQVHKTFLDCLYMESEIESPDIVPDGAILVNGITINVGLHPGRLAAAKDKIAGWLHALPGDFQNAEGGGASFLRACNDADGEQWTGLHRDMQELFLLGLGCQLVRECLPRELWGCLYGGMPYYVVL